jgi:hypothetical protein
MKSSPSAAAAIYAESVIGIVVAMLIESGRQVEEMVDAVRDAVATLEGEGGDQALQTVIESAARLRSVKLLLDKINDWAIDDPLGFIAGQASSVEDLCAVADTELEVALRSLAASCAH